MVMSTYWIAQTFFKWWHDEMFSFWSRICELMSRNLCEAAQLALDQRAPHRYFDAIKCCWLGPPPHPPPPFCWLAPRAPICAQAELILGPWNNNYRSYSQSIDTEWATFRGRPEIPQLLILSSKQFQNTNWNSCRILQQREYSCTVSILSCPSYIQDTPVAAVAPPLSLAGCL